MYFNNYNNGTICYAGLSHWNSNYTVDDCAELLDYEDGQSTMKEILDFTSEENTYVCWSFILNNLSTSTSYTLTPYGRTHSGTIYINAGGLNTAANITNRTSHQQAFMKVVPLPNGTSPAEA